MSDFSLLSPAILFTTLEAIARATFAAPNHLHSVVPAVVPGVFSACGLRLLHQITARLAARFIAAATAPTVRVNNACGARLPREARSFKQWSFLIP